MGKSPHSRSTPDAFLALRGDRFRRDTDRLRAVTTKPFREVLARAGYIEVTLAIVEDGGRFPIADEAICARRLRMSSRLWRSIAADLERAELLTRTPDGYWSTPAAADELERRMNRVRVRLDADSSPTRTRTGDENRENTNVSKGPISPYPLPPPFPFKPPISPQVSEVAIKLVSEHVGEDLARQYVDEYVRWQGKPKTERATNDDLAYLTFCEDRRRQKPCTVKRKAYWAAKAECREVAA